PRRASPRTARAAGFAADSCSKEYSDASTWHTCPGAKSTRKGERLPFEENYTPRSRIGSFGFGVLYAACKNLRLLLVLFRCEIFQQAAAWKPFFSLRLDRRERNGPVAVNGISENLSRLSVGYSHALPVIHSNRCHYVIGQS